MFALRKIIGSTQSNFALGIQYEVLERFVEPEKFAEVFEKSFGYPHVADLDKKADNYTINCYGFVLTEKFSDDSDIDLVLDIGSKDPIEYANNYFNLKFSLQSLFHHSTDLLENKAFTQLAPSPFFYINF